MIKLSYNELVQEFPYLKASGCEEDAVFEMRTDKVTAEVDMLAYHEDNEDGWPSLPAMLKYAEELYHKNRIVLVFDNICIDMCFPLPTTNVTVKGDLPAIIEFINKFQPVENRIDKA